VIQVELRGPWSTRKHKCRELSLRVRAHGRGRWRWWGVRLCWPGDTHKSDPASPVSRGLVRSLTLEAKSWLTDESMRGNLRHKTFARIGVRAGMGGIPQTGRYCPVLGAKGKRCTWERGHLPMVVQFDRSPVQSVYAHSWRVPRLGKKAHVVQEPRRPQRV
jgi:hypothetical protein